MKIIDYIIFQNNENWEGWSHLQESKYIDYIFFLMQIERHQSRGGLAYDPIVRKLQSKHHTKLYLYFTVQDDKVVMVNPTEEGT